MTQLVLKRAPDPSIAPPSISVSWAASLPPGRIRVADSPTLEELN